MKRGTEAHVELTVSQVKHNTARLIAPVSAAERRQDSAYCLTGDLHRHVEQAAAESPCCCSVWTFWELLESVFLGYCPLPALPSPAFHPAVLHPGLGASQVCDAQGGQPDSQ